MEQDMSAETKTKLASEGAVNVDEACKLLGIKRTMLYKLMGDNEIAYALIGKRRVIPRRAIQDYLAAQIVAV